MEQLRKNDLIHFPTGRVEKVIIGSTNYNTGRVTTVVTTPDRDYDEEEENSYPLAQLIDWKDMGVVTFDFP